MFHVSQLKRCLVPDIDHMTPMEGLKVGEDLTYEEQPIKILETSERVTQNRVIRMCKVQWNRHREDEATWEQEDELRKDFSNLFEDLSESRGRDSS